MPKKSSANRRVNGCGRALLWFTFSSILGGSHGPDRVIFLQRTLCQSNPSLSKCDPGRFASHPPTPLIDRSIDRCTTSNTGGRSWDPRSRRRDQPPATSSKQQHHQHQQPTQASSATYRAWTHTAPSQHAAPPPRPPPESRRSCGPPPAAARGRARGAWAGG